MLNKNELEKIVVTSAKDLRPYEGKTISDKYILMECVVEDVFPDTLERCFVEGGGLSCRRLVKSRLCDMETVTAEEIEVCIFEKCRKLQCGDCDEGYKSVANQFVDCREISIEYAEVRDCIFNDFESLFLRDVDMNNCLFTGVTCADDCAIVVEDGVISECSFEHIKLLNESYLMRFYGSPWMYDSVFMDICTSRADREIFDMEDAEDSAFVDEDSCSGLALIADLGGNIDMGRLVEDDR